YARDMFGNVQKTSGSEGSYEDKFEGGSTTGKKDTEGYEKRDGNWYAKGTYKYTEKPIMKAMSTASEMSESSLKTKATLAGVVDVNFKSDYFPLEKMADSFQIAQIQNVSKPVPKQPLPGTPSPAPAAAQAPAASPPPATSPATTTPAAQPAR